MEQCKRAFLSPILYKDLSLQFGGNKPFLDRITAVLFMFGMLAAGFRFFDLRWFIPVLWIAGILFTGGVLTIDPPFYPRLAGLEALLFVPVSGVLAYARKTVHPLNRYYSKVPVLLTFIIIFTVFINILTYFYTYAYQISPDNIHYRQTKMAYFVKARGPKAFTYCFPGYHFSFGSGTVTFIAKDCFGRDTEKLPTRLIRRPINVVIHPSKRNVLSDVMDRLPQAEIQNHYSDEGDLLFISAIRNELPYFESQN